ncbi:hypothetical protein RGT46_15380, partial [Enterococcus faecalis]
LTEKGYADDLSALVIGEPTNYNYKTGKEIQAIVISPLEDIQITPIKVSQAGESEQFCQAKGFRIIAGSEKFVAYSLFFLSFGLSPWL